MIVSYLGVPGQNMNRTDYDFFNESLLEIRLDISNIKYKLNNQLFSQIFNDLESLTTNCAIFSRLFTKRPIFKNRFDALFQAFLKQYTTNTSSEQFQQFIQTIELVLDDWCNQSIDKLTEKKSIDVPKKPVFKEPSNLFDLPVTSLLLKSFTIKRLHALRLTQVNQVLILNRRQLHSKFRIELGLSDSISRRTISDIADTLSHMGYDSETIFQY